MSFVCLTLCSTQANLLSLEATTPHHNASWLYCKHVVHVLSFQMTYPVSMVWLRIEHARALRGCSIVVLYFTERTSFYPATHVSCVNCKKDCTNLPLPVQWPHTDTCSLCYSFGRVGVCRDENCNHDTIRYTQRFAPCLANLMATDIT